jgi:hypothetical protein
MKDETTDEEVFEAMSAPDEGEDLQDEDEHYFGVCPTCGKSDGNLNIGRNHWSHCKKHKTKWYTGSNLFSAWKDEPAELHEENAALLSEYSTVVLIAPNKAYQDYLEEKNAPLPESFYADAEKYLAENPGAKVAIVTVKE